MYEWLETHMREIFKKTEREAHKETSINQIRSCKGTRLQQLFESEFSFENERKVNIRGHTVIFFLNK